MLINCVAYDHGSKLADIDVRDISDYLQKPDCFVWVALRDPTNDELMVMQTEFGLHDLAVEDARNGHQRPKVEEYEQTLFVVMQTLELDPLDELRVGEIDVFAGRNFVLSIRNRSSQSLLGVRQRTEREPHLLQHGSGFVLYALMDAVVDRYFPIIDSLESKVEAIEQQIFTSRAARSSVEQLWNLKQQVTTVKHAVAPLLEAVGKLWSGRVPAVCEKNREYLRDVYDHLSRINASLDTLRETITTAIQVNLSMVTIEESETTKRLAAWAGMFAVATMFAGIWGMNFKHMPELDWELGYPLAVLAMVAIDAYLFTRFRKAGWL